MPRFRLLAVAATLAAVSVLGAATAASAHDELIDSSPAAGEALALAPTEVTLQFSADVLTVGATVIVIDADGTDWTAADPVLDGATVTVPLQEGMPDAGYELRWRVVSGDGHPIAGVVPFTIGDGEPFASATPEPTDTGTGSGATTDDEHDHADTVSSADQNTAGDDTMRAVAIGTGGAIAAIAVLVLVLFFRRRAPRVDTGSSRSDDADES